MDEDKLVIQGTKYSVNTLSNLPQDLNGYFATSKFGEGSIAFFGQLNPFSNFHPAPFTLNGKLYPTSEHYIQEACALYFNDKTSAQRILNAKTPLDAKKIGSEIVGFNQDRWVKVAKNLVKPGISEKFHTHQNLGKVLLATENMTIAKATFDKFWGTGIAIHEPHSANKEKWHGVGILGEILMEIHDELQKRNMRPKDVLNSMEVEVVALPEATSACITGSNLPPT